MNAYAGRYLRWTLAPGEVEPHDPLGDLRLVGDEGAIEEKETLIDAYLLALSEGLKRLPHESRVQVDVVVEPHVLALTREGASRVIGYRGQTARVEEVDALVVDLQTASQRLLEVLDAAAVRLGIQKPSAPGLRRLAQPPSSSPAKPLE
ncbi:MAG: hypothetical protein EOO71_02975 [Myxococcaceae bacterium]|nr:MAG: hypothetical protein EOO71_02975 [Myxococcaceae bacterium]